MKPCWAQYLLWTIITLAGVSAMLAGCGQTGPLYLPDDAAPQTEAQTESQTEPQTEKDEP